MTSDRSLISRAPVAVKVAGYSFWLPYRPAAAWAEEFQLTSALVSRMATPEDREILVDLVMSHPDGARDLRAEGRRVLAEVSGWPWWSAQKLIATAIRGEALGRLVLAGVDPWQRTLGEWCAAVYALYVKGADEKNRMKLDFSLSVPPPDAEAEWDDGGDDAEATMNAVQALMGQ